MNNDNELLQLAAKAAGLKEYGFMGGSFVHVEDNTFVEWNPLTDDGDALRLAVKLGIQFEQHPRWPYIAAFHSSVVGKFEEPHGDNPYAATRRAIVRAAAEIGRMK